jgi:hypothetical protein
MIRRMLDLETLAQNFLEPLQTYCGIAQLIRAGEVISPEELQNPRIAMEGGSRILLFSL